MLNVVLFAYPNNLNKEHSYKNSRKEVIYTVNLTYLSYLSNTIKKILDKILFHRHFKKPYVYIFSEQLN